MKEAELWLFINKTHPFLEKRNHLTGSSVLNKQPFNSNVVQIGLFLEPKGWTPLLPTHPPCEVRKCWTEEPRLTSYLCYSQCVCKCVLRRRLWAWKLLPHAKLTDSLHCLLEPRCHLIPNTPGESPLSLLSLRWGWRWAGWGSASHCPSVISPHHLTLICPTSKIQAVTVNTPILHSHDQNTLRRKAK